MAVCSTSKSKQWIQWCRKQSSWDRQTDIILERSWWTVKRMASREEGFAFIKWMTTVCRQTYAMVYVPKIRSLLITHVFYVVLYLFICFACRRACVPATIKIYSGLTEWSHAGHPRRRPIHTRGIKYQNTYRLPFVCRFFLPILAVPCFAVMTHMCL